MFIRNAWYIGAWAHEIEQAPLARTIMNEPIVFFRDQAGKVCALEDRCCHRGAPLRFGQVIESGLECGYHGMVFDGSGRCVKIPAQDKIPAKARVQHYAVVEKDEFVWIWMGDADSADETKIIDYPFHNDHERWPHKHAVYEIAASYKLMVDNLMDMTHVGYVHKSTIGGNPNVHTDAKTIVTPHDNGLKYVRWLLNSPPPATYTKVVDFKGNIDRWAEFEYIAPSSIVQWTGGIDVNKGAQENRNQDGVSIRLFHGLTPVTETSCLYFWASANGFRQGEPHITDALHREIDTAFKEDKRIVEGQQAMLTLTGEDRTVDLVSDAARIQMRRIMERLENESNPAKQGRVRVAMT